MLMLYLFVNFSFNLMGMYIMKHGSSVLSAVSYSLILPLTVLAFASPLLGRFQEGCPPSALVGLLIVLVGFYIWRQGQAAREQEEQEEEEGGALEVWQGAMPLELELAAADGRSVSVVGGDVEAGAGAGAEAGAGAVGAPSERIRLLPSGAGRYKPGSSSGGPTRGPTRAKMHVSSSLPSFASQPISAVVHLFSPVPRRTRAGSSATASGLVLDATLPSPYLPSGYEAATEWSDDEDAASRQSASSDDDDDVLFAAGFEERTIVLARAGWRTPLPRRRRGGGGGGAGRGGEYTRSESSLRDLARETPRRKQ